MGRPLVFIHGYSAEGTAFNPLRDALIADGLRRDHPIDAADVDICTYISLNNEITITDIAEGLDRAFRSHPKLKDDNQDFDAVVHSTGMLVLRSWLANHGATAANNPRLKRLKHLIGVAPATWGSPQAHMGRTWLGAMLKGSKHLGPDFLNAGDKVLQGLELGSAFTWNLAHQDLLAKPPFYSSGPDTPFVAVFIGNHGYDGLDSIANSPGSDGTVRWAGCGLNTRKITLDLTRVPAERPGALSPRIAVTPWAEGRLDVPMIAVEGRNHSSLIADPEPGMVRLIADFLRVGEPGGETHDAWLARAKQYGEPARSKMLINPAKGATAGAGEAARFFGHLFGHDTEAPIDGWQQFILHAVDTHGNSVSDYFVELFRKQGDDIISCQQYFNDSHPYGLDKSFRCFHVQLPQGISDDISGLVLHVHASTGTELMCYQGYGDSVEQLTATAAPVILDISELAREAGSFFTPFTTTLLEIQLNREPLPLNEVSKLLSFLQQPAPLQSNP